MATDRNRVVAYLSDEELGSVQDLSEKWGLSLSKAIARAVREVGLGVHSVATASSVVDTSTVTTLVKDEVGQAIAVLESKNQAELDELRGEVEAIKKPFMAAL